MTERPQEYTVETAAIRLGVAVATLNRWRSQGKGPPYIKRVHRIFYTQADLDAFDAASRRTRTRG